MQYSVLNEKHLTVLFTAIKKQNVKSVYEIDYLTYIQDVGEVIFPDIKQFIKKEKIDQEHLARFQYENRVLLSSTIMKLIQDKEPSTAVKIDVLFFYKSLIEVCKKAYDVELVDKQEEFLQSIEKQRTELEELKKEEDEILAAIFAAVNDEVPKLEPPLQPIIPAKNIYFKLHLGFRQKQKLQDWLSHNEITPTPVKLLNFLNGENQQVEVNPDKLHYLAYLLFKLNSSKPKLLEVSFGKGVFKHFQTHFSPFVRKGEKRELKDYKREVVNKKNPKTLVITKVDALLDSLKQA